MRSYQIEKSTESAISAKFERKNLRKFGINFARKIPINQSQIWSDIKDPFYAKFEAKFDEICWLNLVKFCPLKCAKFSAFFWIFCD